MILLSGKVGRCRRLWISTGSTRRDPFLCAPYGPSGQHSLSYDPPNSWVARLTSRSGVGRDATSNHVSTAVSGRARINACGRDSVGSLRAACYQKAPQAARPHPDGIMTPSHAAPDRPAPPGPSQRVRLFLCPMGQSRTATKSIGVVSPYGSALHVPYLRWQPQLSDH